VGDGEAEQLHEQQQRDGETDALAKVNLIFGFCAMWHGRFPFSC
jgi:hypothetical protein